jgi:hypothetical protein
MNDEPFGRQGKRVNVTITGGDAQDREHWARLISGYLNHQPCCTYRGTDDQEEVIAIMPDAVND